MNSRLFFVVATFFVLSVTFILRAAYLQFGNDHRIERLKKRQFETQITIRSQRGSIKDRNGHDLAVSVSAYSLYATPSQVKNKGSTAKKLSKILKIKASQINKKLSSPKRNFVWIKRQLSKKTKNKIEALKVQGLDFIEESKRIYPRERLLSQTLGFVGRDNQGLEGLEFKYEKELASATETKINFLRDAKGRPLVSEGFFLTKKKKGNSLKLTIDKEFQFFLEQELSASVLENDANSALGIILDAQTSEILAFANVPSYDLNNPLKISPIKRKNHLINSSFELGSTIKTFIVAEALERDLVRPNTKIFCENGELQVDDRIVKEAGVHKYGDLTVSDILKFSSNIGISKIAFQLGDQVVYEAFQKFGFGQKTQVDLPGEQSGIFKKPPWRLHHLSNISFGQGISATALQMANAYAAIANGGVLRRPRIVKAIIDGENGTIRSLRDTTKKPKRVLSKDVADIMRLMLNYAAPSAAQINGFPVSGKTGTAQKVDLVKGGYKKDAFLSSFAGFLPANDPRFVVYIMIDEPRKHHYGSQVAAPVFAKLASYIARKAQLPPTLIGSPHLLNTAELSLVEKQKEALKRLRTLSSHASEDSMPSLIGMSLREAYQALQNKNVKIKVKGHGFVTKTFPKTGASLKSKKTVELTLR